FQEERYPQALVEFQRAQEFDPQNAAVQFYQGVTLYQLKRYEEALPYFQRASQLNPEITVLARFYQGLTLFALDRDTPAREAFQVVQAAEPTSSTGQNAQQYLDILRARERERRLWQVDGNISLQYDDNVTVGDDQFVSGK